jgi:non-ribosomal peptide synthetase component E (peptide arylation enzyme)
MTTVSLLLKLEQNAAARGEAIAIQCGHQVRTWSDLERRSYYLALNLSAMGCGPQTRVAVLE